MFVFRMLNMTFQISKDRESFKVKDRNEYNKTLKSSYDEITNLIEKVVPTSKSKDAKEEINMLFTNLYLKVHLPGFFNISPTLLSKNDTIHSKDTTQMEIARQKIIGESRNYVAILSYSSYKVTIEIKFNSNLGDLSKGMIPNILDVDEAFPKIGKLLNPIMPELRGEEITETVWNKEVWPSKILRRMDSKIFLGDECASTVSLRSEIVFLN